jgi:hypothetical protein
MKPQSQNDYSYFAHGSNARRCAAAGAGGQRTNDQVRRAYARQVASEEASRQRRRSRAALPLHSERAPEAAQTPVVVEAPADMQPLPNNNLSLQLQSIRTTLACRRFLRPDPSLYRW